MNLSSARRSARQDRDTTTGLEQKYKVLTQDLLANEPDSTLTWRLSRISDKLYIHIDLDVLDPREVMGHGNKVLAAHRSD